MNQCTVCDGSTCTESQYRLTVIALHAPLSHAFASQRAQKIPWIINGYLLEWSTSMLSLRLAPPTRAGSLCR